MDKTFPIYTQTKENPSQMDYTEVHVKQNFWPHHTFVEWSLCFTAG